MTDLTRSTRLLLDALALIAVPRTAHLLDIGSTDGAVACEVGCTYVNNDLTACQRAAQNGLSSVLHSDVIPDGPFHLICFDAHDYDPGLAAETVAAAAARLTADGILLTTARAADVRPHFGQVEPAPLSGESTPHQGEVLIARFPHPTVGGTPDPINWPSYAAEFAGRQYQVQTGPGVFSPRGLDEGTQFMLSQIDAACAVRASGSVQGPGSKEALRFLDLGCGTGIISRIATDQWGYQATAVDVSARALRLAKINAPEAEVVASDGFAELTGRQFDLIASNPPYHTDFAIAKSFIEGAFRHLVQGGLLFLVVKRSDWYVQKVRNLFGGCRVSEENGYTVISAEKREARPKPMKNEAATTKKHARRMADASKRKRRP